MKWIAVRSAFPVPLPGAQEGARPDKRGRVPRRVLLQDGSAERHDTAEANADLERLGSWLEENQPRPPDALAVGTLEWVGPEEADPYRASGAPDPIFDTDFALWVRFRRPRGPKLVLAPGPGW